MYKYTARKDIAKQFVKLGRTWSTEANETLWNLSLRIAGTTEAVFACGDFWVNYTGTKFFSKTKLEHVPVNGVLIKVEWFDETVE